MHCFHAFGTKTELPSQSKANAVPAQALFLLAIIVGIAAGCLLGTQPSVNGTLSRYVGHPLQATLISFGSGCLIVMILATLLGVFPPRFSVPPGKLPWWVWSGGAIGTVLVTASLIFVPKIGSLPWFAAVMTGQILVSLVLDHWGLLGNPRSPISSLRLLGAGCLVMGVLTIVWAKSLESKSTHQAYRNMSERHEQPHSTGKP